MPEPRLLAFRARTIIVCTLGCYATESTHDNLRGPKCLNVDFRYDVTIASGAPWDAVGRTVGRWRVAPRVKVDGPGCAVSDVQVNDPVPSPAPFPAHTDRIDGRPPRAIAVGVVVENSLRARLQHQHRHVLSHSVDHVRDSEQPDRAFLRYLQREDRPRKIRPPDIRFHSPRRLPFRSSPNCPRFLSSG
jgi:hypothetical protein